jgi:hypothetical protein
MSDYNDNESGYSDCDTTVSFYSEDSDNDTVVSLYEFNEEDKRNNTHISVVSFVIILLALILHYLY